MPNCIIVRSRLHAISACELLKARLSPRSYILVETYSRSEEQKATLEMKSYRELRNNSLASFSLFGDRPVHDWIALLFVIFGIVRLSNGSLIFATIDSYPIALPARAWPGLSIQTFDDGNANFKRDDIETIYHAANTLSAINAKRLLLRLLFPRGSTQWFRQRIKIHYALDIARENIVAQSRMKEFQIQWDEWLEVNDMEWAMRISPKTLMLGTAFGDFADQPILQENLLKARDSYLHSSDIYLPHPRELDVHKPNLGMKTVIHRPHSPVESLITFWLKKRCLEKVYHFGSAAAVNIKRLSDLKLIDLMSLSKDKIPSPL